jgi:hypothetical protein
MIFAFPAGIGRQLLSSSTDRKRPACHGVYIALHKNVNKDIAMQHRGLPQAFLNRLAIALP